MCNSARVVLGVLIVLCALPLCGCSFLYNEITFTSAGEIQIGTSTNFVRANVINNSLSQLAFGPPLVPIVPWPTRTIPELSYWRSITISIDATNPRESLILDLSDAALHMAHESVQSPVSIDLRCIGPGARRTDKLITLPSASQCSVYLTFGLSAGDVEEFDVALGTLLIGSERYAFPVSRYVKHRGLVYDAFSFPFL
jgi:hypothetical protein